MAPPLIDRIQQNLQPTTTTTWANVPNPVTIAVQTGGDFGIPQPIIPPTADVTFAYDSASGLSVLGLPGIPVIPGQPADTFTTEVVTAQPPNAPSPQFIPPVLVEVGRAFPSFVATPPEPAQSDVAVPALPGDTLAVEISLAPQSPSQALPDAPIVLPEAAATTTLAIESRSDAVSPAEPGLLPVPPLVETGRAFPPQITVPEAQASGVGDLHGLPGDTFATEGFEVANPSLSPGAIDTPVSPADLSISGEGVESRPQPTQPIDFVFSVEGPFVFVFSPGSEGAEFVIPGYGAVPPPLVTISTGDVGVTASPNVLGETPGPLVEVGVAPGFSMLTSAANPFISALVAGAIALTPSAQVSAAFAPSVEVRVEEPTQPFPQRPIDWLWGLDIKWEAEPPPNEVTIEEPLLPLSGIWADVEPPSLWMPPFVVAISSWVPPPQPEPPPPPPPRPGGGGGGGGNPFGVGGGACPPCPPRDPCEEEEERERFLRFFQYLPPPGHGSGPLDGTTEDARSMVPSGTPQSLMDDFLQWIKVPENRRKVKKAVRWGLGAWAVYKRWKE